MPSKRTNLFRANLTRSQAVPDWRQRHGHYEVPKAPRSILASPEPLVCSIRESVEELQRAEEQKASARKFWEDILGPI